ncbi:MAG TPA: response regulator transcription factor [Thermomicrobiales bacterium]|nr:response regulator transcription factor [Thermomicrobiales bacterium]
MRILVVEDNRRLSRSLKLCLEDEGYAVDAAFDGREGQEYAEAACYDAIVLDVMLPEQDGLALCRALRRRRVTTPIIMLTARDAVEDRVRGLDSGADDYLVKPFALSELHARLRALLRRESTQKGGLLAVGDLTLDPAAHEVTRAGRRVDLTAREFAVLEYFMRHPNQVITREMVEAHIWSYDFTGVSNVVDVYVRRLRRKIDDPREAKLLQTVRGVGYRLTEVRSMKYEV